MAKRTKLTKALDAKHFGEEPDLRVSHGRIDIVNAYNWYSYNCDSDQAKAWVLEYWKEFHKEEKEVIKNVNRIDSDSLRTCGWNCRILSLGGVLPDEIRDRMQARIRFLAAAYSGEREGTEGTGAEASGRGSSKSKGGSGERGSEEADRRSGNGSGRSKINGKSAKGSNEGTEAESEADSQEAAQEEDKCSAKPVISIQERIANRANELIADIEVHLDNYYRDGTMFKPGDWLSQQDVKPAIAQRIADHYKPLYSEVYDAYMGTDVQLREGYSHYKKPKLKAYMEFLQSIVSAAETRATVIKTRKPRKKKEKPAHVIVAKLQYKSVDETFKLTSVEPKQLIGAQQVWVFNTKYRTLAVYNAMGPAGISVKGSTLTGFDEKTSLSKKLRKPEDQLRSVLDGGKVALRNLMGLIKCKPQTATGRLNKDVVIVRVIK